MENETKIAGIWSRPGVIISIAGILVVCSAIACGCMMYSQDQFVTAEHAARMEAELHAKKSDEAFLQMQAMYVSYKKYSESCQSYVDQQLSSSIDRLKTKTILISSLPAQPQGATIDLTSAMSHAGMLGLLLDVVQSAQKQTGRAAAPPAQAWILPTSIEPMFAGDVDRAWVIHVDAATSKPVDQPHHPFPVQK
jgi:hypothetical protein